MAFPFHNIYLSQSQHKNSISLNMWEYADANTEFILFFFFCAFRFALNLPLFTYRMPFRIGTCRCEGAQLLSWIHFIYGATEHDILYSHMSIRKRNRYQIQQHDLFGRSSWRHLACIHIHMQHWFDRMPNTLNAIDKLSKMCISLIVCTFCNHPK